MQKKLAMIICTMLMSLLVATAVAAAPVEMSANEIEYNSTTEQIHATGKVVLKREAGTAKADSAQYNVKNQTGRLQGNVSLQQEQSTLVCDALDILSQNHFVATGSLARVSKGGDSLSAPQISYYDDRQFAETNGGNALLNKDDGSTLTANYISYDMRKGEAVALENVQINAPARDLEGAGDKAVYLEDKTQANNSSITLSGNAWAIQNGNKIVGNRLVFKTGKSQGEASGKVVITIPPETPKTGVKK